MQSILRVASLITALVVISLWFFGGMNTGRTQTRVAIDTIDPDSGEELVIWENRFLPGTDFVGGGFIVGAILYGGSFLCRKK